MKKLILALVLLSSCTTYKVVMRPVEVKNNQFNPSGKWEYYDEVKMKQNCGTLYQVGRMRITDKALTNGTTAN